MKQDTRGQTIWAKTFPTDGKKVRRLANRRILAKEVSYFEAIKIILLERVTIFIVVLYVVRNVLVRLYVILIGIR